MQEVLSVTHIISGGQTGADQGGLAAGVTLGLSTGGWAPAGWRTEAGPAPGLARLGLREHNSDGYSGRTAANIRDSDGTLIVAAKSSSGSRLTARLAQQARKPCLWLSVAEIQEDAVEARETLRDWLAKNRIRVLNVAGNRESVAPGIARITHDLLVAALA